MARSRRPLRVFIPNTITLLNLAIGCLAVMEAWNGRFGRAALMILVSAVLDFFDGFAARMLRAYSDLGKELDSLADLVSFGVAPAALAAMLIRRNAVAVGWDVDGPLAAVLVGLPLLIPVFSAIRLGRFNLMRSADTHFSGMPVPADAVAFTALALIQIDSRYGGGIGRWILHPASIGALIILNSWLMVAPLAMFSFKLKSYRPSANRWRSLYVAASLGLVVAFRGLGLFGAFVLYVLSSLGMNLRLRRFRSEEAIPSSSPGPSTRRPES